MFFALLAPFGCTKTNPDAKKSSYPNTLWNVQVSSEVIPGRARSALAGKATPERGVRYPIPISQKKETDDG